MVFVFLLYGPPAAAQSHPLQSLFYFLVVLVQRIDLRVHRER